jgi:hypothetical protein
VPLGPHAEFEVPVEHSPLAMQQPPQLALEQPGMTTSVASHPLKMQAPALPQLVQAAPNSPH